MYLGFANLYAKNLKRSFISLEQLQIGAAKLHSTPTSLDNYLSLNTLAGFPKHIFPEGKFL